MDDERPRRRLRPIAWGTCAFLANSLVLFVLLFFKLTAPSWECVPIFFAWILMWAVVCLRSRDLVTDGLAFFFTFLSFAFLGIRVAEEYKLLPTVVARLPVHGYFFRDLFIVSWIIGGGLFAWVVGRRFFLDSRNPS